MVYSSRRQETGDRRQETGDRRQETGDRRQQAVGILLPLKLKDIAAHLTCRLDGDAGIERAGEGELTFFANPKYATELRATNASAVIMGDGVEAVPAAGVARLVSSNPYLAFAHAVALFAPRPAAPAGIHPLADVAPTATIAPDASIAAFVSIGDGAHIGARSIVYPHATIG